MRADYSSCVYLHTTRTSVMSNYGLSHLTHCFCLGLPCLPILVTAPGFWLLSSSAFYMVSGTGSASAVVLDSASASPRSLAASGRRALQPKRVVSPTGPITRLAALALERILYRKSASRCVMTTLHLGRDDRGKENAVSPP